MVKLVGKSIALSDAEAKLLSKSEELVLLPHQEGVFLLVDSKLLKKKEENNEYSNMPKINLDETKQEVIGLIRKDKLSDLVEGKFESTLNEVQKLALHELLNDGKVFVFKLNESYKKGVYRVKDEEEISIEQKAKESENFNAIEKQIHEYNLDKDGFMIANNSSLAKELSQKYEQKIKEGILKGIKSFDGYYYLIEQKILEHYMRKATTILNEKEEQILEELAQKMNTSKTLTKIICEFLKDEGELLEKKKGHYKYIK